LELYIFQALMGALMFGIGAVFFKWLAHIHGDDSIFFTALYGSGAVCFFIDGYDAVPQFGGAEYYISGLLIGLGAAGGNYFFSRGLRHGPAGLTSAFAKANIIIVILLSAVYYREPLILTEIIGILFFLLAMLVVNLKIGKAKKAVSSIWFFIMVASMVLLAFRNGGLKIVNEIGIDSMLVMALAYFICTIIFALGIIKNKKNQLSEKAPAKKVALMGLATGIASYVGLFFYITALESGPASVVVTIFSLDMLFLLVISYLFFGERLSLNQKVGFILSAIGFLLLGLK
jgi:uncharacterized membrane protein